MNFLFRTSTIAAIPIAAIFLAAPAHAATLRATSALGQAAQPGDVIALAVLPAAGERIIGIGMNAFDTQGVKFFAQSDGSARAFVGFPFDRSGKSATLYARVQIEKNGQSREQTLSARLSATARYYPTQRISMNSGTASTMSKTSALRAEKLLVQSAMKNSPGAPLWSGAWLVPTGGRATSTYGRRRYVNGKWWGQHNGADIKALTGAPVRASNAGRVVLSEYLPTLRGNCIVVDHGNNVFSLYLHLSKRLVSAGDNVSRGQLIGKVGATGFVTGPHLHWEMRVGWEPVDPFKIVRYGLRF